MHNYQKWTDDRLLIPFDNDAPKGWSLNHTLILSSDRDVVGHPWVEHGTCRL